MTVPLNQKTLHICRILFIKIFRSKYFDELYVGFENELVESSSFHKSKFFQDFLNFFIITMHFNYNQKPFIAFISPHCNLFYSLFIWKGIFEILEQDQKMLQKFHQLATLYINPYLSLNSNNYIQSEAIQFQQLSGTGLIIGQTYFKALFQKAKDIIQQDSKIQVSMKEVFNTINLVIIACNLNPEFSSSVILNLMKIKQYEKQEFIKLIEIQEGNQLVKPIPKFSQFKFKNLQNKILNYCGLKNYSILKSLKFLDLKEDYISIILISKSTSIMFKEKMIRYYLTNKTLNKQLRLKLWKVIINNNQEIDLKNKQDEYQQACQNKLINESAVHHISLDKSRSINTTYLDPNEKQSCLKIQAYIENTLEQLLRIYANENREVSYYQGMNMVMAFFLFSCNGQVDDKEQSYILFDYLIQKMQKEIFLHGLEQLRIHFYMLDRFIAIYIPQIFQRWKQLEIEGSQFATVWYVTLFTYALQINQSLSQDNENEVCFELMDLLIANKWAGFYSIVVSMIDFYKEYILKMDQSETLMFLNNIAKSCFFYYPIDGFEDQTKNSQQYPSFSKLKMKVKWFKIKKSHLVELEKEYNHLREKIDHLLYKQ